jgi:4'-phosphopantetheinyl transferase EntD
LKRRNEFYAGREAARIALSNCDLPLCVIPVGVNRSPSWPVGIIGSISHSDKWALAVVSNLSSNFTCCALGIDIESDEPLPSDLIDIICSVKEREHLLLLDTKAFCPFKLTFSLKESVFKSLHPYVSTYFDFKDVVIYINIESQTAVFDLKNNALFSEFGFDLVGAFSYVANHVITCVWGVKK